LITGLVSGTTFLEFAFEASSVDILLFFCEGNAMEDDTMEVSADVYQLQLTQLQEQLVAVMIDNETLSEFLLHFILASVSLSISVLS